MDLLPTIKAAVQTNCLQTKVARHLIGLVFSDSVFSCWWWLSLGFKLSSFLMWLWNELNRNSLNEFTSEILEIHKWMFVQRLTTLTNECAFPENFHNNTHPKEGHSGNSEGEGVSNANIFKGKYEDNLLQPQ